MAQVHVVHYTHSWPMFRIQDFLDLDMRVDATFFDPIANKVITCWRDLIMATYYQVITILGFSMVASSKIYINITVSTW